MKKIVHEYLLQTTPEYHNERSRLTQTRNREVKKKNTSKEEMKTQV